MTDEKITFVALNCVGHGISVQTKMLTSFLEVERSNVKIFRPILRQSRMLTIILRLYGYLHCVLSIWIRRPELTVILANYFPFPIPGKKIVLMRHAQLLDETKGASVKNILRQIVFKFTLKTTNVVVLQKVELISAFRKKYANFKGDIYVLPNPIRDLIAKQYVPHLKPQKKSTTIIYPSGYYAHKGFKDLFLGLRGVAESDATHQYRLLMTINHSDLSSDELAVERTLKDRGNILLEFLGKVSPAQMNYLLSISDLGIFSSKKESYGNGMFELDMYPLPFIYTSSLAPAETFSNGFPISNWEKELREILPQTLVFQARRGKHFLSIEGWVERIIEIGSPGRVHYD